MATLYPTYTVTVQDATSHAPRTDLMLFLFEGKVEFKTNPTTTKRDVFIYGTNDLAVAVLDKNGAKQEVLAANSATRPGEYDFLEINFGATTASDDGTTLYSVVARPSADTDFTNGSIIVSDVYLSDPNLKQEIAASFGDVGSINANIAWAGGTVNFEICTDTGVPSQDVNVQYLKILNLPSVITAQFVDESALTPTLPTYYNGLKLVARFDVHYCDGAGSNTATMVWKGIPAYQTTAGSWVIKVTNDHYCVKYTKALGASPLIDLRTVVLTLRVSINLDETNVFIRKYDNTPATTILLSSLHISERPMLQQFYSGSNPIVAVGNWDFSSGMVPSYNLDVLGSLGLRVTDASGNQRFVVTPTLSQLGDVSLDTYDTFDFSSGIKQTFINFAQKLLMDTNIVWLGNDLQGGGPSFFSSSAYAGIASGSYSGSAYIRMNSSGSTAEGRAGVSGQLFLDATNTYTKIGFDMGGAYFRAQSGQIFLYNTNQVLSHLYTSSSVYDLKISGRVAAGIPSLHATATYIRFEGGLADGNSNSIGYIEVANSQITGYVPDLAATDKIQCFDLASTYSKFGYDVLGATLSTSGYFRADNNGNTYIYQGGVPLWYSDYQYVKIKATTTSPYFYGNATEMAMQFGVAKILIGQQTATTGKVKLISDNAGVANTVLLAYSNRVFLGYNLDDTSLSQYLRVDDGGFYLYNGLYNTITGVSGTNMYINSPDIRLYNDSDATIAAKRAQLIRVTGSGPLASLGVSTWCIPLTISNITPNNTTDFAPPGAMIVQKVSAGYDHLFINCGSLATPKWTAVSLTSV